MKEWARALELSEETVSFHVIEAVEPAQAILDYARFNQVDHIVMGARGHSTLRRYLGSVSARIVAEAPCSVTVVRLPQGDEVVGDQEVANQAGDEETGG